MVFNVNSYINSGHFLHHALIKSVTCTSDFCSPACFCESFEPRSHLLTRFSMIVRVNVVLYRTVVVDSDWRFNKLSCSHLQSQSELYHTSWWYWHNSLWLWRWLPVYRTGCWNNNSPIQDYVHPDNRTQPTYLIFLLSIWFNVCRP